MNPKSNRKPVVKSVVEKPKRKYAPTPRFFLRNLNAELPAKGTNRRAIFDVFWNNPGISREQARRKLTDKGLWISKNAFGSELFHLRNKCLVPFYGKHVKLGSFEDRVSRALVENKREKTISELARFLGTKSTSNLLKSANKLREAGIPFEFAEYSKPFKPVPVLTPKQEAVKKKAKKFVSGAVFFVSKEHNFWSDTIEDLNAEVFRQLNQWILLFEKERKKNLKSYIYDKVKTAAIDLIRRELSSQTGLTSKQVRVAGSLLRQLKLEMKDLPKIDLNSLDLENAVKKVRIYKEPPYRSVTVKRAREYLTALRLLQMQNESRRIERPEK